MTLPTHINTIKHYTGDGTTTVFDIPYQFLREEYVEVYVDGTLQNRAQYSIINCTEKPGDNGCLEGADVSFVTAPPSGDDITIRRKTRIINESDYFTNLKFLAEVPERTIDKITMILQELADAAGLAATVPGNNGHSGGGPHGRTILHVIDVAPAQIITNVGSGEYVFRYCCFDPTSTCFVLHDTVDRTAFENNLCANVDVGQWVAVYSLLDTSGDIAYRFNSPSEDLCLIPSECGGPIAEDPPGQPPGDPPVFPPGGGGEPGADPLDTVWVRYDVCGGAEYGWHLQVEGAAFYYDLVTKVCIERTGTTHVGLTPPGNLLSTLFLQVISSCADPKCENCDDCVCSVNGTATVTYTWCNLPLTGNCNLPSAGSAATMTRDATPPAGQDCRYDGTTADTNWTIAVWCDTAMDKWVVDVTGSSGDCNGTLTGANLSCSGGKPVGTAVVPVETCAFTSPDCVSCNSVTVVLS